MSKRSRKLQEDDKSELLDNISAKIVNKVNKNLESVAEVTYYLKDSEMPVFKFHWITNSPFFSEDIRDLLKDSSFDYIEESFQKMFKNYGEGSMEISGFICNIVVEWYDNESDDEALSVVGYGSDY
jgi:hypothetical protein